MSRRFWSVPVLALLAAAAIVAAKPPDLPQKLAITVEGVEGAHTQALAGYDFICKEAAPDRHVRTAFDPAAGRTVLECLDLLIDAGEDLEKARKHVKAGEVGEALACVARIMQTVPGSNVAEACDEVIAEVTRCLARATPFAPKCGGEEAAEPTAEPAEKPCCNFLMWLGWVDARGRCWISQVQGPGASSAVAQGKCVMVDGLLKSAHLALGEGRVQKARELVKQAHALDPQRVEADPLVYKMHLLPVNAQPGGEERSEPLPDHPRQKRKPRPANKAEAQVTPNIPELCPDFIEAMERALKANGQE
jgi:hypothetical protein